MYLKMMYLEKALDQYPQLKAIESEIREAIQLLIASFKQGGEGSDLRKRRKRGRL